MVPRHDPSPGLTQSTPFQSDSPTGLTRESSVTERATARLAELTKPLGSLGQLEAVVTRISSLTERVIAPVEHPVLLVFAADHGVVEAGVSAYGADVTEEMVVNLCMGGSVSSVLARQQHIPVTVVDVGVRTTVRHPAAIVQKVGWGTANFTQGPAMTRAQVQAAVNVGRAWAKTKIEAGHDILLLGEMGIGNTTASSALTAALLHCDIAHVLGHGTGVNEQGLQQKYAAIARALAVNQAALSDLWDVLAALGGFEIAALAGAMWEAAEQRIPVLLDGFITCAAALWAVSVHPPILDVLFASHVSAEPGHRRILDALGLKPLVDVGLRLGEGSGALFVFPMLQMACRVLAQTATFEDARVSTPHPVPEITVRGGESGAGTLNRTFRSRAPTAPDFSPSEQAAFYKAILARRDIRVFLPDAIPDDVLERILQAGHHGPSVGYMQPWDFGVIRDRTTRVQLQQVVEKERLVAAEHFSDMRQSHYLRLKVEGLLQAPVTLCVTNNPHKVGPHVLGRNTIPETDLMSTACAIENMWLAARVEGIAVGWVSIYQKEDIRRILGIPDTVDPVALLTLGYTPHFPEIPVLERVGWGSRLPLSEVLFENTWGTPYQKLFVNKKEGE
jgi:nicotinate-nucleotide--dimethylbenzimidazole phosphoribosyltransferase